ncbi:hypothetical protein BC828DRAFT_407442 [Blastocladiella britannica]|nr:hypothetical protein BC828DRAFT_407442 [Blastocladiella britannica]
MADAAHDAPPSSSSSASLLAAIEHHLSAAPAAGAGPPDPTETALLRARYRDTAERLIVSSAVSVVAAIATDSDGRPLEDAVWRLVYYPVIKKLRTLLSSTNSTASADATTRLSSVLDEAAGFFVAIADRLRGCLACELNRTTGLAAQFGYLTASDAKILVSLQRCWFYLGDIARYRAALAHSDSEYWLDHAMELYHGSLQLYPSGRPCSQIALLLHTAGCSLEALLWILRGVGAIHESPMCTGNMQFILSAPIASPPTAPLLEFLAAIMIPALAPFKKKQQPAYYLDPTGTIAAAKCDPLLLADASTATLVALALVQVLHFVQSQTPPTDPGTDLVGHHLRAAAATDLLLTVAARSAGARVVVATWAAAQPDRVRGLVDAGSAAEIVRAGNGAVSVPNALAGLAAVTDTATVGTLGFWDSTVDPILTQLRAFAPYYTSHPPDLDDLYYRGVAADPGRHTSRAEALAALLSTAQNPLSVSVSSSMGKIRLVRGGNGLVLASELPPFAVVLAPDVFDGPTVARSGWAAVRRVIAAESARIVVPIAVLDHLDRRKKYSTVARDAVRVLEAQLGRQSTAGSPATGGSAADGIVRLQPRAQHTSIAPPPQSRPGSGDGLSMNGDDPHAVARRACLLVPVLQLWLEMQP